jgi:inner membrane protein
MPTIFSHAIAGAALASALPAPTRPARFLATASHGVLDALTDGGPGIAFVVPFDDTRYFLPWQPIRVSPISLERFLSARGLRVLRSEAIWVWLPSAIVAGAAGLARARSRRSR